MSKLVLYCSVSCPFARRGMLAARFKEVEFEEKQIPLGGHLKNMEKGEANPLLKFLYKEQPLEELQKIKEDYKRDLNATGEVPTLVHTLADGTEIIVSEAELVAEYLEDAFPQSGVSLMPQDPAERYRVRHWLKVLGTDQGVRGYYGCIMNQDPTKDEAIRANIYKGFAQFAKLASPEGPFFLGEKLSLADVLLFPMYDQFVHLLPHYRGVDLFDASQPWAPRLEQWAAAAKELPHFKNCRLTKEQYIGGYVGYAAARGVSKFGE